MRTKAEIDAQERKWRADDAIRTLTRAEEIRADKKLMADVAKQAKAQANTLAKVAGASAPPKPAAKAKAKPAPKPAAKKS